MSQDQPYRPPLVELSARDAAWADQVPPVPPPVQNPAPGEVPRAGRWLARARRWLLRPRSLAARLTLGVVGMLVFVVLLTSMSTYFLLKPFLNDRLSTQLNTAASTTANSLAFCAAHGRCDPQALSLPTAGAEWLQIAVAGQALLSGESLSGSDSLRVLNLSDTDFSRIAASPGKIFTIETTDHIPLRVSARLIRVNGELWTVIVGLSLDELHFTLRRLLILEVLIGCAAIVLAGALTAWGVKAGLRPLTRVTRTAQEVTAELGPDGAGLDRRVPGPEDSTEVGRVASSVNTLLATVEAEFTARLASEERMRQFLADASHELRTPLTSIRGFAELARLQGRASDPDDPMHRIEIEGTRMSRLVEDLLVLARGDRDELTDREPVAIDTVLTEAVRTAKVAHPERPISVRVSGGAVVSGDPDELIRLFVNLLNNACVHTAPGGAIWLEGKVSAQAASVVVRVIDAGPGLDPAEAGHVFERFWRADKARTRSKGGSGLGMAIVAQIVQSHRGVIQFVSSVESGTTVTVTLPMIDTWPDETASADWPAVTRQN
jgi:two-component system OmpR family sensor kinase